MSSFFRGSSYQVPRAKQGPLAERLQPADPDARRCHLAKRCWHAEQGFLARGLHLGGSDARCRQPAKLWSEPRFLAGPLRSGARPHCRAAVDATRRVR